MWEGAAAAAPSKNRTFERVVFMKFAKRSVALLLSVLLVFSAVSSASAAGALTSQQEWEARWDSVRTDTGVIALTPGSDETEMRFAWLSELYDLQPRFKIGKNADLSDAAELEAASRLTLAAKLAHKVTATGLEENTAYYYSYTVNGLWRKTASFKTGGSGAFKALLVSDIQIGRSGDESLDEVLMRDSYGWNRTLETAAAENPDISFILSAGDQVNTALTNKQYNALLAPEPLRSLPFAAAMGNHDFSFPLYRYHFNNPNEFTGELFEAPGGSAFWFTRGNALFLVLNSNATLPFSQESFLRQAVEANPDAVWRVVLMHHSIYGANGDGGLNAVWKFYASMFDDYDIDLVLSGHDHVHCRTYPLKNGQIDTDGTVYLSENSSSGSKYSGAPETAPWYAASCRQDRAPTYSVLAFEDDTLTLDTYRADTAETIDEPLVLTKGGPDELPEDNTDFFAEAIEFFGILFEVLKSAF